MMRRVFFSLLFLLAAAAGPGADAAPVAAPPAALRLDPFYAKYVDARGLPVIGSARAAGAALERARAIVTEMLAHRPDLRAELARQGVRVGIIAAEEAITDLPENRGWRK